ncbi:hypothetical protein EBU71_21795 [bacterium]|nr:hypothetical protein [Candidatus Elulimicrobium humile]
MKKKKSNIVSKKSKKVKAIKPVSTTEVAEEDSIENDPDLKKILSKGVLEAPEVTPDGRKLKPKEKVHYVNGKEFEEEIRAYYKSGVVTQKLGESLTKIANGLSYAPNFINYSYKDDMIGDAIVKMFSALRNKKFKLDTGFSPFSYFTTIAFHAFINRIKKENKHHAVLNEYRDKVYTDLMLNPDDNGNSYNIYVEPGDDNYNKSE